MIKKTFSLMAVLGLLICHQARTQDELIAEVLATWKKHTEMNVLLAEGIDEAYLADQSASGGRTVGEQLAHMHNVRLMWVGKMLAGLNTEGLDTEIDKNESASHAYLLQQLALTDELVRELILKALKDKTKFGEMSAIRFMGYLIAHEAHTRGQIILALKQSHHPLPPQITYGIWQW